MPQTAGVLIIGDEILRGAVRDENSWFICVRFRELGVDVRKVVTVGDDVKTIATEAAILSAAYDCVITSGGVGPTHDDVTYQGIASAFGLNVQKNDNLIECYKWYVNEKTGIGASLYTIPEKAEVLMVQLRMDIVHKRFPIVKCQNVYMFPGVPSFMHAAFIELETDHFENKDRLFVSRSVYLNVNEIEIAKKLKETAELFAERSVIFGSYPNYTEGIEFRTKITIDSHFPDQCIAAENYLFDQINPTWIHRPKSLPLPSNRFIWRMSIVPTTIMPVVKKAFGIIEECLSKYDASDTFISFNGGKDCTALFHLVLAYCEVKRLDSSKIHLLYVYDPKNSFPEIESFVEYIKRSYPLKLITKPRPIKEALKQYLLEEPGKKLSFLGVRNTDPFAKDLKYFQETDNDWPKILRVFPILSWSYKNLWDVLRLANIPYCSLYDKGYTSIGSISNTSPNPALRYVDEDGSIFYKPAFLLDKHCAERYGRTAT